MENAFLNRVKQSIHQVEPDATIVLYGSRARGDFRKFSDWDFLVLVDSEVDYKRTHRIRHQLHEIEWETGEVLCAIVRNRREWKSSLNRLTMLSKNIELEGVPL
jgi:uncharacterized protein